MFLSGFSVLFNPPCFFKKIGSFADEKIYLLLRTNPSITVLFAEAKRYE